MIHWISSDLGAESAYGIFILVAFFLTRPAYLMFRRRRSSYGIVFNSVTGKPESLVAVVLRDLHGSVVRSTATDRNGRYRLIAPKGDYIIEVRKFGLHFPSKIVKGKSYLDYEDILNIAHIIIKEYGAITKNIPIDPVMSSGHAPFHFPRVVLPKQVQYWILVLSPFIAYAAAIWLNSVTAWTLFIIFVVLLVRRFLHFKPAKPPFGTIVDAENGRPLKGVVVRVLDKKFNKVLETQITSPKGRYAFIVHKGSYRILIKKPGYHGIILNFNGLVTDGHLLAKDVKMKRTIHKKEEEPREPSTPQESDQKIYYGNL